MIKETRGGKFGRFFAAIVDGSIESIPKNERNSYFSLLEKELTNFSFKRVLKRDKNSRNGDDDWELTGFSVPNLKDPIMVAKTIKEARHLNYQTNTAYHIMRGFLYYFNDGEMRPALDRMRDLPKRHRNWDKDEYIYSDFP